MLTARSADKLQAVATEIEEQYKVDTKVVVADISEESGWKKVIAETEGLEIGLFVPNAGVETHGEIFDIPLQDELKLIDINIKSVYALTRHFGEKMKTRRQGGMLLVASIIGHMPNPYLSNYAASKAYVVTFGHSLRYELGKYGVDVSVLSPGITKTAMVQSLGEAFDINKMPLPKIGPRS